MPYATQIYAWATVAMSTARAYYPLIARNGIDRAFGGQPLNWLGTHTRLAYVVVLGSEGWEAPEVSI